MVNTEVINEAQRIFGFVPSFIEESPEHVVGPVWDSVRDLLVKDTNILKKYKALVALAAAAFRKDRYLVHAAREYARHVGASDEEIRETLALAGDTSLFSTWLNGRRYDMNTFEKELHRMVQSMEKGKGIPPRGRLETRDEVIRDVEAVFGTVPTFIRDMPDVVLRHMWQLLRGVELEPTRIPGKYKGLIGLAVASSIPCQYCILFHTTAAKLMGASEDEVKETILLAGLTRNIGTIIYGLEYDLDTFKRESSRMAESVRGVPLAAGKV